ncbi:hypothetical protein [Sphingobacterium paludis]|uniref:Uncharacterized protein n=1 Tax=Sphingobacterium paludis TaxID=1476465 RepID=A0A4R7CYU6_9SPHI|nr:hypothetical protein [Sphingobacterium paludis]TDS13072.1 hypothetical protein B0I21_105205 [Sphingobacterium paludis]
MEAISDLNTFAKILTAKGYDGYFHTQGAYAGKLKASISEYLANSPKGVVKQELLLTCFLQWAGEDLPRVECLMRVKYLNGKFFLNSMEVAKKDRYGQVLKQSELTDLSVVTAPKAKEAIAMVSDAPAQKATSQNRRFKH